MILRYLLWLVLGCSGGAAFGFARSGLHKAMMIVVPVIGYAIYALVKIIQSGDSVIPLIVGAVVFYAVSRLVERA